MKKEKQKELTDKYPELFTGKFTTGFQCRDGWFELLDNLCGCIYNYCDYKKLDEGFRWPRVVYLKEKFGSLSILTEDGDDEKIWGMICLASYMSRRTCEFCGRTVNVGRTYGQWIYTICEVCREKNPRALELEWEPSED